MELQRIKTLLDKYYQGETTLEEERLLKEYFSKNSPSDIDLADKYLVDFFLASKTQIPVDLNEQLDNLIENEWERETKLRFSTILKWAGTVAAVLIVALGILYYQNREKPVVLADSYQDPQEAYEETKKVLLFISNKMNSKTASLKHLSEIDNSLKRCNELSKIDKSLNTVNNENN